MASWIARTVARARASCRPTSGGHERRTRSGSHRQPGGAAVPTVDARRGDLDAAVHEGVGAFGYERRSVSDLVGRADELAATLRARFPGERRADELHDRLAEARRAS